MIKGPEPMGKQDSSDSTDPISPILLPMKLLADHVIQLDQMANHV